MKVYITVGTHEYLKSVSQKYSKETMVLIQNTETSLLFHETHGDTVFKEPRQYKVVESSGFLEEQGFFVFNHIPVTDEGRPVFEYRFKNRVRLIDQFPGFIALRVLRPLLSDTYIVMTVWQNEDAFNRWQNSKQFKKAQDHSTKYKSINKKKHIFPRPSYVTKYYAEKGGNE
ncbi:antibiotic biosynthesis monooxygenase [Bacillus spongiae]|uniref:Antibiotic biosynthesis monooxygenase n=1 Tax=Bacillus spongiae TaxID=2683610 RepID=A0ABU8HBB2_9BACI